jgi:hypothetical protein
MGAPQKYATRREQAEAIVAVLFDAPIVHLLNAPSTIAAVLPDLDVIVTRCLDAGQLDIAADLAALADDLRAVTT